jgi:hypothetical protein
MARKAELGMGSEYNVSGYRLELESKERPRSCSSLNDEVVRRLPRSIAVTDKRREFVKTEALKACVWYLLYDLCWYPLSISPYKSTSPPDIFSDSLPRQAFFALAVGIMNYCTLNLQYSLGVALTVAIGMYTPQDWPRLMGRLREVSTVRDFWGKFWYVTLSESNFALFRIICEVFSSLDMSREEFTLKSLFQPLISFLMWQC